MEPVCDDDEDDKKWKRAVRQVKEDAESKRKKTSWRGLSGYRGGYGGYFGGNRRGFGGYRRPSGLAYSGGRGYFGSGRYVEESRENKRGNCDSGRKIEAAMDVDKLVTSEEIAEVSSQREEEMVHDGKVASNDLIMDFITNKDESNTGVFDKFDKENVEKAEEYLDKLEGAIELEEEGDDIVEMFKDEEGIEDKIHDILICN